MRGAGADQKWAAGRPFTPFLWREKRPYSPELLRVPTRFAFRKCVVARIGRCSPYRLTRFSQGSYATCLLYTVCGDRPSSTRVSGDSTNFASSPRMKPLRCSRATRKCYKRTCWCVNSGLKVSIDPHPNASAYLRRLMNQLPAPRFETAIDFAFGCDSTQASGSRGASARA
jgi:hypothetical protein